MFYEPKIYYQHCREQIRTRESLAWMVKNISANTKSYQSIHTVQRNTIISRWGTIRFDTKESLVFLKTVFLEIGGYCSCQLQIHHRRLAPSLVVAVFDLNRARRRLDNRTTTRLIMTCYFNTFSKIKLSYEQTLARIISSPLVSASLLLLMKRPKLDWIPLWIRQGTSLDQSERNITTDIIRARTNFSHLTYIQTYNSIK